MTAPRDEARGQAATVWTAFLRAVNVGGHGKLRMAELRTTLSTHGYRDVQTLIQSGNVVFRHPDATTADAVRADLQRLLADEHGLETQVVVHPAEALADIVRQAPFPPGADPRFCLVMLLDGVPAGAEDDTEDTETFAPEAWWRMGRVVYVHLPNGTARSKLGNTYFERRWGVAATGRNIRTLRRVLALAR